MRINFRRCKGRKCRTDLWNDKPLPAPETKDGQNFMREHHLYNRLFPSYMSPPSIHHTPLSLSPAATTTAVPTLRIDKLRIGQPLCVTVSPHPLTALTDQLRVGFLLFTLFPRNHLLYTQHESVVMTIPLTVIPEVDFWGVSGHHSNPLGLIGKERPSC